VAAIIHDHYLDGKAMVSNSLQFLDVALEPPVAGDYDDWPSRGSEGRSDAGWQTESHGPHPARRYKTLVGTEFQGLSCPHLMLPYIDHISRSRSGIA
jgi:hypothetical protein